MSETEINNKRKERIRKEWIDYLSTLRDEMIIHESSSEIDVDISDIDDLIFALHPLEPTNQSFSAEIKREKGMILNETKNTFPATKKELARLFSQKLCQKDSNKNIC